LVDPATEDVNAVALPSGSRWQSLAQMPTSRARFAQALMGERIYAISGLTDEGWTDRVEIYDAGADSWSRGAAKPTAVANVGAAVVDGRIYVPGGLDAGHTVRDLLEVYDPATDEWSTASPAPRPLCAYAIAPYGDGFYLFGGWDGQSYLATTFYYDASADTWSEGPPLAGPRGFSAAAAADDVIYLVGGYDGQHELDLCEAFSPQQALAGEPAWTPRASMGSGRAGHAVAVTRGHLYVIGGGWVRPLAYNESYDLNQDAWFTFNSAVLGEWRMLGLSAVTLQTGTYLVAVGGWSGRYLGTVQSYQTFFRTFIP
jgi:N-acetylneuraminic acid mutarotase